MEEDIDVTEEEAYEEIEERIGIQALRLNDKPAGMTLEKVYIDEIMGEAQMEFQYENNAFIIYENKQNEDSAFEKKIDGEIVDTIELFHLNKEVSVIQIDKGNGLYAYTIRFEQGNAYYCITSDLKLDKMESIVIGIIFKNV